MTLVAHDGQAVFGPVPSRRLGMSLGVDLIFPKTCSLDCIYCEAGVTTVHTIQRTGFWDVKDLLGQVQRRLDELTSPPDYITLAGSGEPTLNKDMGLILKELRKMTPARQAILTNATLATDPKVREEMCLVDMLVPSLDAVSPEVFRKLNRPAKGLDIKEIIKGIARLSKEFTGDFYLEMLLVKGINDHEEEIKGLIQAAELINPTKVQLNTVVRPPALASAGPLSDERLNEIKNMFTVDCEVIAPPCNKATDDHGDLASQVVELTKRRPCTPDDIAVMTGLSEEKVTDLLKALLEEQRVQLEPFGEKAFYRGL